MVQVLPGYVKKRDEQGPSFYEMLQLDKALSGAGEAFSGKIMKKQEEKEKKQKDEKQIEALKGITGMDFTGINDPKLLEKAVEYSLNKKNLTEDEDLVQKIIGNESNKNKKVSENPSFGSEEPEERRMDPKKWSDEQIDHLRAMNSKSPRAQIVINRAKQEYERRQELKKSKTKYNENVRPLHSGLDVLDRMEKIGKKGNLGVFSKAQGIWSPETRKDRAEYEQLGKSLIQLATNIPIRNKIEFEALAEKLYDPSLTDAAREGVLASMKRIISNSIKSYENPDEENEMNISETSDIGSQQNRPPLTSFIRQ